MSNSYARRRIGALLGVSPLALSVLSTIGQAASAADDALETSILPPSNPTWTPPAVTLVT